MSSLLRAVRALATGVCALAGLGAAPLHAHAFHLSFGEADFNPVSQRLEVALCVVPEDLELALEARADRELTLEREPAIDALLQEYVAARFLVRSRDGKRQLPVWVGSEFSVKEAWLYFEVPLPGGLLGADIAQRMLLETSADQWNQLRLAQKGFRRVLSFRREREAYAITKAGPQPRSWKQVWPEAVERRRAEKREAKRATEK